MKKDWFTKPWGFSILEIVLASAMLGLIALAGSEVFIYTQQNAVLSGNRNQALFLAEEGLEAARSMRDADFNSLISGLHGLSATGKEWNFLGELDKTGLFTRQIQVLDLDADRKQVISTVYWQQNAQRQGRVSLVTHLHNWKASTVSSEAESLQVDLSDIAVDVKNNKRLIGLTLGNKSALDITLVDIKIVWSAKGENEMRSKRIDIDGKKVWSGNNGNGNVHDTEDVVLIAETLNVPIDFIQFNKNISGIQFNITFTMADGSTKVLNNITP